MKNPLAIPKNINAKIIKAANVAKYAGLEIFNLFAYFMRKGISSHLSSPSVVTNLSNYILKLNINNL